MIWMPYAPGVLFTQILDCLVVSLMSNLMSCHHFFNVEISINSVTIIDYEKLMWLLLKS